MKVINVCGFDFSFEKEGIIYKIPNDGNLHYIPDICYFNDNFQGMLRVIIPPQDVKQVVKEMNHSNRLVDINDENIKEIIIEKIEEKNDKPLKGKRIKPIIRNQLKKSKKSNVKEEEIVN